MRPERFLIELIDRVGSVAGQPIFISENELSDWPATVVNAIKKQKILSQAKGASSAICSGCAEECVMEVYEDNSELFILCDKRTDINRVAVNANSLVQWRCDAETVCNFIADSLGLRRPVKTAISSEFLEVGVVTGKKKSQMLCLKNTDSLSLIVGSSELPLADFINFEDANYFINVEMIHQLVDTSSISDSRYTPSQAKREVRKQKTQETYKAWKKEYRRLKKENPGKSDAWCSRQIAKSDIGKGLSPDTIKKEMK
ncbi:TPA: hypothetical protein JD771_002482 [Legionella pneumophila subsp. pneumophila]|nr:hypothetical protein [Legionella pneumophila subsp. pneumophila]